MFFRIKSKGGTPHFMPFLGALWLVLVFSPFVAKAQSHALDSLYHVLGTENDDTNKARTLLMLCDKLRIAGKYDSTLIYSERAYALAEKLGNKRETAIALRTEGIAYRNLGNYPAALEYDFKALSIDEELGDKKSIATSLSNIGLVYSNQGASDKALDYDFKALDIYKSIHDTSGITRTLGNIGIVYYEKTQFGKASEYDFMALGLDKKIGDKVGIAANLGNIGNIFLSTNNFSKALDYYFMALSMDREMDDKNGMGRNLGNIGTLYTLLKQYNKARIYLDSGLAFSKLTGVKQNVKDGYYWLTTLDTNTKDYKKGLEDYKKYILYNDSLINEANTKKAVQAEMNFNFQQKQSAQKAEQDRKDVIAEANKKKQWIITASVSVGLLLVLAFSGVLLGRFRITQKQKKIIEEQKIVVEEKNKEVLDSITYAKRLQDAMLPPLTTISKHFPQSFVLYKPKDIVAGDFYWMEKVGDATLIAAADCTGHGVPGAMVSIVCSNALNRTVKEFKITEPGKILDKVRELVLETFEKSENNVQDGMDISLAAISYQPLAISWSGAYNSLLYMQDGQMHELPGNKQPIGKTDNPKPFTTHTIEIPSLECNSEAVLYLFTDGYADQFGGPKGKKFKYKQLQEKLLTISHQPLTEQKDILETTIKEWQGNHEQVDDILIMGIKV